MASGVHPVLQSQILCFVIAMQQIGKEDVLHGPNHLWEIVHKAFTLRIRTQPAHVFCNQGWNIHHSPIKHKRVRNLRRGIYWIIELRLNRWNPRFLRRFIMGCGPFWRFPLTDVAHIWCLEVHRWAGHQSPRQWKRSPPKDSQSWLSRGVVHSIMTDSRQDKRNPWCWP